MKTKNESATLFTRLINDLSGNFHTEWLINDLINRYNFSLGKYYFDSDGSQNYFLFKPININDHGSIKNFGKVKYIWFKVKAKAI